MLVSLSTMLQYTMKSGSEKVRLGEDLQWLRSYAHIMENRFDGKFRVEYEVDPLLLEQHVPKLFLQPFVENSILHGFENMESGGVIRMIGAITESGRQFRIEDNGRGVEPDKLEQLRRSHSPTIGIMNVHRRLQLLYGDNYSFSIDSRLGYGTQVVLTLPFEETNSKSA